MKYRIPGERTIRRYRKETGREYLSWEEIAQLRVKKASRSKPLTNRYWARQLGVSEPTFRKWRRAAIANHDIPDSRYISIESAQVLRKKYLVTLSKSAQVGGRTRKNVDQDSKDSTTIVCATCQDTHSMYLADRSSPVPCTQCPVPCATCNEGGFCKNTPCRCECHIPAKVDADMDQIYKRVIDGIPERFPNLVKALTPPHTARVQMSEKAFSAILDYKDELDLIKKNPQQFDHERYLRGLARMLGELHNSTVHRVRG
jgi:hypothetical protein